MKKILFIIHDLNYGGAPRMLTFLANSMAEQGNEIYIYAYKGGSKDYPLDKKIKYIHYSGSKNKFVRFLKPFITLKKTLKEVEPDITISFLTNANLYNVICTRFTPIPSIIAERGDPFLEDNIQNRIKKFFYRFSEGVVFQTEGAKNFYNTKIREKSIVIPNPITFKTRDHEKIQKDIDIISVARFDVRQKRQDLIVKALKKIVEHNQDIKLKFCGDGKGLPFIKEMVAEYKLTNNVIFAGNINNIQKELKRARLFILASDYEGIPNALIEAMCMGLPVISTDCSPGGARLLINSGKNGILVPRNNVEELTNAIKYIFNNPIKAEKMGEEAIKIQKKFIPEDILNEWEKYIDGKEI